ncbi:uncharacterized protein LOC120338674 [Styela clava]
MIMDSHNNNAIMMNCDITVTDENMSDKRDMSVILVPENVLKVLSDSTSSYVSPKITNKNTLEIHGATFEENTFVDSIDGNLNTKNVLIIGNGDTNFEDNTENGVLKSSDLLVLDPNNICVVGLSELNTENQAVTLIENGTSQETTNSLPRPIRPHPSSKTNETSSQTRTLLIQEHSNKSNEEEATREILNCMDGFIESWATKHNNSEKKTIKYKCKIFNCNKTFKTQKELEEHNVKHQKCERYPCLYPSCPWSFSTPYKLKRHLKSHDQIKQYKCTYEGCNTICSTKYNLQTHMNMHNKCGAFRVCPECNETFTHFAQLMKHRRTIHNVAPMFECDECGKKFHTTSGRNTHAKSHIVREFICGVEGCGKRFKRRAIFKIHVMEHSNIKPFKCEYPECRWAFTTRGKLRRHIMSHTNTKRYQCPVENCASQFSRLEHLKSHLKVHTLKSRNDDEGSNDFEAPVESNEDNLLYYLCPYDECGLLFTTLIGAKQHIQKVHTQNANVTSQEISCSKETDNILDTQPVSITLEAMKTNDEILDDNNISDDISSNEKIITDQQSTESLLKTMLRENPDIPESNDILITSVTSLAEGSGSENMVYINTVPDAKVSNGQTLELAGSVIFPPTQGLSTSPTSTIDPSQFLLGGTTDEFSANSEAMKYINIPQYPPSSSTDRFLNFNECDQTVDPNMVMSIPVSLFQGSNSTVSSSYETSDDDDSSICDSNNNLARSSGSARTDVFIHRKHTFGSSLKQDATSSHSEISPESRDSVSEFDTDIQSFIFNNGVDGKQDIASINDRSFLRKRSRIPDDQFIKESHDLRGDFTGSTINLNDLA